MDQRSILAIEARPPQHAPSGNSPKRRAWRILPRKLHPGKLGPCLHSHQRPFAGQNVTSQSIAQKGAAPGCNHHGVGPNFPGLSIQSGDTPRSANPVAVHKQFKSRALVEQTNSGLLDDIAHQPHIFRALDMCAHGFSTFVNPERITPALHFFQAFVHCIEHAMYPGALRQKAALHHALLHGSLPKIVVRRQIQDIRPPGRCRTAAAAIALIGQNDLCSRISRTPGRPCTGWPAAKNQYIHIMPNRIGVRLIRLIVKLRHNCFAPSSTAPASA